eukprot:TRINITY_DN1653_c0_g1_i1.p1 TRINITY_DN1653_c0_g1~~TRINITY_DN1653_c0_g1_i1.p1  ORF type:complete len:405 (-),score=51.12 TRINITY_DN1653_c0_g1_i1:192-1406(-)
MNSSQSSAGFFDPTDSSNAKLRDSYAMNVLEKLIHFLTVAKDNETVGHIGIHDATNSSKARRRLIEKRLEREKDIQVLWIESICNDTSIIQENIKLKIRSPDYKNKNAAEAIKDFTERLKMYEVSYEQLDESDNTKSYIKLIDVGRQILTNNIRGYVQSQIITYLMNYNVEPRHIWVTRHGESMAHVQGGILGGDSDLSPKGYLYSAALVKFFNYQKLDGVEVWTSTLIRSKETGRLIENRASKLLRLSSLNEINAGLCEGMTYKEIEEKMPEEFEARNKDKLRYRYPRGGESYIDLIGRLRALIIELERKTETVFIISHQAVLRTIIGYWINCPKEQIPYVEVPFHTVLCLTPTPFGCIEARYEIDLDRFESGADVFWTVTELFFPIVPTKQEFRGYPTQSKL